MVKTTTMGFGMKTGLLIAIVALQINIAFGVRSGGYFANFGSSEFGQEKGQMLLLHLESGVSDIVWISGLNSKYEIYNTACCSEKKCDVSE